MKPCLPPARSPLIARRPCSALFGRQPAMLPDKPILDHEQPTETSDQSREEMMREGCIEGIARAAPVAKTN
eukprot:384462-Pyramimonas_sp.AAC.1